MPAAPRVKLPIKTGGGGAVRTPASPANPGSHAPRTPADPILRLAREQKRTLSDREMQAARQIDNDWQTLVAVPLGVELTRFADRYQQALDALAAQNAAMAAAADDGSDDEADFGPVSAGGPTSPANPGRFNPRSPVSPANPGARMGGANPGRFAVNTGASGGGDTVPSTWLLDAHGGDAHGLLRSVRGQITKFAQATQKVVAHAAADASAQGMTDGQQLLAIALQPLVDASGGELDPEDFLQAGVAAARNDARFALLSQLMNAQGPLAQLLGSMPQESADQAYRTLLYGLGHGENPQALVSDLQQILNSSRSRALTISRTEMMNAYRGAQIDNYRANSDVVQGWIWLADMSSACPMCVDLNGEVHPLDDDMVSHPRCRCSPAPYTKSWDDILSPVGISADELGLEDTSLQVESGEEWFARQDEATQRAILGPAAFNAYQGGALQLSDLVGRNPDGSYYQKSLKEAGLNFRDYLPTSVGAAAKSVESEVAAEAESIAAQEAAQTAEREAEQIARDAFSIEPLPADVLHAEQERALDAITGTEGGVGDASAAKARVSHDLAERLKDNPDFQHLIEVRAQQWREKLDIFHYSPEKLEARIAELTTPENVVSDLIHSWAAADDAFPALQRAVREEFALTDLARMPNSKYVRESLAIWKDAQPGLRAFVREMYNNTQDWLKANGIDEMVLYRGMGWAKLPKSLDASLFSGEAQEIQAALRAASSFSADMSMAAHFADMPVASEVDAAIYQQVIAARVPAELILSTPQTGVGALAEYEAVVLGGTYDVMSVGIDNSAFYTGDTADIISGAINKATFTDDQIFALLAQEAAGGE